MTTFQIIYQDVPYNYTAPHGMLVEAESPVDAWITAYNELTRRGNVVQVELNPALTVEDWKRIEEHGIKSDYSAKTHIRNIKVYNPHSPGKVISVD